MRRGRFVVELPSDSSSFEPFSGLRVRLVLRVLMVVAFVVVVDATVVLLTSATGSIKSSSISSSLMISSS